jgi:DNA-binding NarL/FixJ family response regulator
MIRIIVAEDHDVVRDGIVYLLRRQQDFEVVGQFANGCGVLELLDGGLSVDVVLSDLRMREMDGITLTQRLTLAYPLISVIILSMQSREYYASEAFRAGAKAYIQKSADAQEIFHAIRQVYTSQLFNH